MHPDPLCTCNRHQLLAVANEEERAAAEALAAKECPVHGDEQVRDPT